MIVQRSGLLEGLYVTPIDRFGVQFAQGLIKVEPVTTDVCSTRWELFTSYAWRRSSAAVRRLHVPVFGLIAASVQNEDQVCAPDSSHVVGSIGGRFLADFRRT